MIPETFERCKALMRTGGPAYTAILLVLIAVISFGLGRLSRIEEGREPIKIEKLIKTTSQSTEVSLYSNEKTTSLPQAIPKVATQGKYVASKNGKKYYRPWCSGVSRINPANKVWFETKEEAEKKGYTPSETCKGI